MAASATMQRDWWENVPRDQWASKVHDELPKILIRCPRTTFFLSNEEANYARDVRRKALRDALEHARCHVPGCDGKGRVHTAPILES